MGCVLGYLIVGLIVGLAAAILFNECGDDDGLR